MRHLLGILLVPAILLAAAWSTASLLAPESMPSGKNASRQLSRLSSAISLNPADASLWQRRAQSALAAAGGLPARPAAEEASRSLAQASRLAPSWEVPLLKLANSCATRINHDGGSCGEPCQSLYLAVLRRDPTYGYAHYRYADLLYDCAVGDPGHGATQSLAVCRQYGRSLKLMRRTLNYDPWYIKAEQRAYARCVGLAPGYAQARALGPESPRQWATLTEELVKLKGPEAYYASKEELLQDIKEAPGSGNDYQAFSRGLELAGLARAGVDALRHYLELHPDDANTWHFLLQTMLSHKTDFTRSELAQAVAQAHEQAHFTPRQTLALASAACRIGQLETALDIFQQVVARDPSDAEAFASLGGCLLSRGRLGEAIQAYGRAVALKPDSPDYHVSLARAFAKDERYQAAVEQLQQALTLQPDHQEAKRTLREIGVY
ncbi:MAG: tetratricopeptide repeat protein [Proteobacteria bacterium]|nr:tetratricopeptide repeat protein [Pseudomonadota bacterium]MBU4382395.1 tetratricopeptide repeat protein [Pseudomonadota bacterium]MBU4606642.1 tetratricopeptide repeat protein [Pseudomonadota bacterium]MCG2763964.1 tetratricopeptide repeat protein [Desulfarculaceae bacterium]